MKDLSYSMLNALGYTKAVGEQPRLARASTASALRGLSRGSGGESLARRSRLYKAVQHLRAKGFSPVPALSTIRRVVLQSAEGLEAVATSRGEVIIEGRLEKRFFNGEA